MMRAPKKRRCPYCGESLRPDAAFCRYCNHDLEDLDLLRSRIGVRRVATGLALFFGFLVLLVLVGSLINR